MAGKFCSFLFAAVYLCLPAWACFADGESPTSKMALISGNTMGTKYHIKIQVRDDQKELVADLDLVKEKVDKRLDEINQSMSTYIDDSEISQFNRATANQAFDVSDDFFKVAQRAIELNKLTGGRFDATVGPLVRYWGFGGGVAPKSIPTDKDLKIVLRRIGSDKLVLDDGSISKTVADLEVDFSAIAKGYAVDQVFELLAESHQNYMVEIGGEVRTSGLNADSGKPWAIGIELPSSTPTEMPNNMAARVELNGKSLATSGDYRNVVVIEGQEFQHTIDPVSGLPVDNGIHSVSVVCDDCMSADGIATGLMVHSLGEIQAFCKQNPIGAFVIYEDENGQTQWWSSDQFDGQVLMADSAESLQTTDRKNGSSPIYMILGTIVVFGLAISGMAIGVIMSNRELKGSCGGLSAMNENGGEEGDVSPCSLCTKPASECSKRSGEVGSEVPAE